MTISAGPITLLSFSAAIASGNFKHSRSLALAWVDYIGVVHCRKFAIRSSRKLHSKE
jgi:hypothetical protein